MNRDPKYYLEKADFFYQRSKQEELDDSIDEFVDGFEYGYDDGFDNGLGYEYDIETSNPNVSEEVVVTDLRIKPQYKRIYDPVTKHYYKIDRIFEDADASIIPKSIEKNTELWYPANNLSYKTMFDPKTNRFYRVNKIYDDKGKFRITHDKLTQQMIKLPGTSYYKPIYQTI